jgi:hypothetical protein
MAGRRFDASGYSIIATDGIHSVSDTHPIHLPHIWNNCSSQHQQAECAINVTTVTESKYSRFDTLDTGFYPESADELRTKLASRQTMLLATGLSPADAPLNVTDAPSICGEINQKSIDWAWHHAPNRTRQRFMRIGEALVIGPDMGPYNAGPLWINKS